MPVNARSARCVRVLLGICIAFSSIVDMAASGAVALPRGARHNHSQRTRGRKGRRRRARRMPPNACQFRLSRGGAINMLTPPLDVCYEERVWASVGAAYRPHMPMLSIVISV